MPRSRVPIKGSIGKSILTGRGTTVVQQTIVQQTVKGSVSGVGGVASTIWPLIQQIPIPVLDVAALSGTGVLAFDGTNVVERTLHVNAPLTITDADGAAGNPTISLTESALTKTDDTNVTLTLGGSPASALVAAVSLTLGWTGQLSVARGGTGNAALAALTKTDDTNVTLTLGGSPGTALVNAASITVGWTGQLSVARGGSGAATLTGFLVGNGTGPFTAVTNIPAANVSGLATVATTGAYSDLTGKPTLLISPLTTKGDVWGFSTTNARVPVGADGTVLTADSTQTLGVKWAAAAAGSTGANPAAAIGLTAVNGSATTFLRSDGAPALSQAIAPTWTGAHLFNGPTVTTVSTAGVSLGSAAGTPEVRWTYAAGATDSKAVHMYHAPGAFVMGVLNDANTVEHQFFNAAHTGTTVTAIVVGNSTDFPTIALDGPTTVNGNVPGATLTVNTNQGTTVTADFVVTRNGTAVPDAVGRGAALQFGGTGGYTLIQNTGQTEIWQNNGTWRELAKWDTQFSLNLFVSASGPVIRVQQTDFPAYPATWSPAWSIFGPNVIGSNTGAALGMGYSNTAGASYIISLQPGVAWKPLTLAGSQIAVDLAGANAFNFNGATATGSSAASTTSVSNKPGAAGTGISRWLPISANGVQYYIPMWQ